VKKYQKLLAERVGEGCDVREHYRPFLAQSRIKVDHVHWHLLLRRNKDEVFREVQEKERGLFRKLAERDLDRIKKQLL